MVRRVWALDLAQSVKIVLPEVPIGMIDLSDDSSHVRILCTVPDEDEARLVPGTGSFLHGPLVATHNKLFCVQRPPVPAALSVLRKSD